MNEEEKEESKKTVDDMFEEYIGLMEEKTWAKLRSIEIAVWILAGSVILGYVAALVFLIITLRAFHF